MTLSDEVAAVVAENVSLKGEIEKLRAQVHRQEGAIKEGRSERQDILNKLDKITSQNAYLTQHFHTIHGSAEHIANEQKSIAAMYQQPPIEAPKKLGLLDQLYGRKEKTRENAQVDNTTQNNGSVHAIPDGTR